jgi:hypothetical protein
MYSTLFRHPFVKKMIFKHFIITRFNLSTGFSQGREFNDKWLYDRCSLFQIYCAPSVSNQSITNFTWIVLMAYSTPKEWIDKVKLIGKSTGLSFDVLLIRDDFELELRDYLRNSLNPSEFLITTRLDNDDCIHYDFVRKVQSAFERQNYYFVEFVNGYTFSTNGQILKQRRFVGNPFTSLIERFCQSLTTVYNGRHLDLRDKGPFLVFEEPCGWVQVIHGGNVYNKSSGILVTHNESILKRDFNIGLSQDVE